MPKPRKLPTIRNRYFFIADVLLMPLAVGISFLLRLDIAGVLFYERTLLVFAVLAAVVKPVIFHLFGLYRRYWRYASANELVNVALAMLTGTAVATLPSPATRSSWTRGGTCWWKGTTRSGCGSRRPTWGRFPKPAGVMAKLQARGTPSRPYFTSIHLQPFYVHKFGYQRGDFPVTEEAGDTCLALPFSGVMAEEQVDYVCGVLKEAVVRNLKLQPAEPSPLSWWT